MARTPTCAPRPQGFPVPLHLDGMAPGGVGPFVPGLGTSTRANRSDITRTSTPSRHHRDQRSSRSRRPRVASSWSNCGRTSSNDRICAGRRPISFNT